MLAALLMAGCHRESPSAAPPSRAVVAAPHPNHLPAPMPSAALGNRALALWKPTPTSFRGGSSTAPRVALTFDAGSDADAVPIILDTLAQHHVHATFFLTGKFCERFPRQCRAIAEAGMELGNHSYSHPHFTKLSAAAVRAQLTRAEAAIIKTCGRGAKPLFRFPYGDEDKRTRAIVVAAGYQPVAWTLDSLDSVGKPKSADFVAERIDGKIKRGYITLMHVSCVGSAQALPRIFAHLDEMGAQVVPVSELLLGSTAPSPASKVARNPLSTPSSHLR